MAPFIPRPSYIAYLALLLSLSVPGFAARAQETVPSPADLIRAANAAYEKKDWAQSAQLFEKALQTGRRTASLLYDTACVMALSREPDRAFRYLDEAIRNGYTNSEHLKTDSDLDSLHADARWLKLVRACADAAEKHRKERNDPRRARFITSDIDLFWKTYDHALQVPAAERPKIYQTEYLDRASIGVADFAASGRIDAVSLARTIDSAPQFYAAIRPVTEQVGKQQAETRAAFIRLKELLPDAQFPDVYFLIGQMRSGGTASDNGLLMGTELFTRTDSLPTSELSDWTKNANMTQSEIPPLVAHESIHFQQHYSGPEKSLLRAAITEGSADFIGELASGKLITRMQTTHRWANARERSLWEEFQKEMDGTDYSRWLYKEQPDRPVDLGYWMGYKICEAYYKNAVNKKQALHDILTIGDFKAFLTKSRYAEKFAP